MMARPMKTLVSHHPMIQFLINLLSITFLESVGTTVRQIARTLLAHGGSEPGSCSPVTLIMSVKWKSLKIVK